MAEQETPLHAIVDGTSITVDPITKKLKATPINTVATGVGVLTPTRFFARPTGVVQDNAGIPVATAHQNMLGHGVEFTLSMFDPVTGASSATTGVGWTSGDISVSFQAALDACAVAGGGTVQLPAGRLTCNSNITVASNFGFDSGFGRGVLIRGKGRSATKVSFPNSSGVAIHFGVGNNGTNYSLFDGIEHLSIVSSTGSSPGTGLQFSTVVFGHIRDVCVAGFNGSGGVGCRLSAIGAATTQDFLVSNSYFGLSETGMSIEGCGQMTFNQATWNQNTNTQLLITNLAAGQFTGCLIQGTSPFGLRCVPDAGQAITVAFSTFYTEGTFDSTVKYEGGVNEGFINFNGVIASATNSAIFFDLEGCHAVIEGASYIPANATIIKARSMKSLTVVGEAEVSTRYDFDTTSARCTTWVSPGGMAVGTPAPVQRGTAPNMKVRTYASDGAFYDTFPGTNFIQVLTGIWGPLLRACWHAGIGIDAVTGTGGSGAVNSWTDAINGYILAPSSNSPTWAADGSNFRSRPVVQCSQASARGLRLTPASPAIFLVGETPALIGVARWRANANNASLFDVGINAVSDPNRIYDDATNHVATIAGTGITGPAFGTTQHQWFLRSDGATTSVLTIDTTDYTTASGAALGADQTAIGVGANASGASGYADVSVACLVLLSAQGTATQRAATARLFTREFG